MSFSPLNSAGCITRPMKVSDIKKRWLLIDATGLFLGRLASQVAFILRGKNKPSFTPFLDCGDNVIIINADSILLSGKKDTEKEYLRHTGYPGGQRFTYSKELLTKNPEKMILKAIKGMLPKNKLGRKLLTNVRVFRGEEHNMASVQPEKIKLKY